MKVAFIFTSSREEIIKKVHVGKDADTALRGSNYIPGSDCLTIPPQSIKALLFLPRLFTYDFIIAQDNLFLGYVVSCFSHLFHLKTKWLYVAINSSTLIRRNENRPFRLFLLKKFWSSYARIACLSKEQLEDFVRLGIPRSHLTFIPFGVHAHFFKPSSTSKEGDMIVSVGRDSGRDYETLFEAAKLVNQQFVVVASPRNISATTLTPQNVSILYDKSLAEIRDLYKRAQIVVVSSKDSDVPEGSDCSGQTVILDALATGKAVIATHRSWISDYFIPDEDLMVVDPHNPQALADAINILSRDAGRREKLAKSGHDKVTKQYTTEVFAAALVNLMDSLN